MSLKTGINDYSAFGNIFRDGTLGILISTGLLGTMVPNSIEAVGKVQELNSFLTLSLFSVIYFVFPILIFTSYWLFRGERQFFLEKFDKIEFSQNRSKELKDAKDNRSSMKEFTVIKFALFAGKLVPLCFFIFDQEFFTRLEFTYELAVWYFIMAIGQNICCIYSNTTWLHDRRLWLGEWRTRTFPYWSYCINALVFFLDIIIGLALVMFSKPWIFYSNGFYPWIAGIIVLYALLSLGFSFFRFKQERLRLEDFVVAILLASVGLAFPSVNLHDEEQIAILTFAIFIFAGTVWLFSGKEDKRRNRSDEALPDNTDNPDVKGHKAANPVVQNIRKSIYTLIAAVIVLAAAGILNRWLILGTKASNLNYMTLRYEASQQVSETDLFPLFNAEDSLKFSLDIHKTNIVPKRLRSNMEWANFPYLKTFRNKFFPGYVSEGREAKANHPEIPPAAAIAAKYFGKQEKIDHFYNDIFVLAEKKIKPYRYHDLYRGPLYAQVVSYAHPLDYMGARLKRLKRDKDNAEDMIDLSETLLRLSLIRYARDPKNPAHWAPESLSIEEMKATIDELNNLKKASPELGGDEPYQVGKPDTAYHARLVRFHKLYYEFCELKYIEAYKGAQKVYRSYLVDTQRVGVWAFFVTLLTLGLATYFNNRARYLFQPIDKDNENTERLPLDTPKNALFIQTVAIFILLVPLMKPIEPEHIDPEKSYWMISLQSWHSPTFFDAITNKEHEKHVYTPGRTVVITQPPDFSELSKSIEGLSNGISESAAQLGEIEKELERIRVEADSQEGKVKKNPTKPNINPTK